MKPFAALLFFIALEAVITEIGALNCTTCSYETILTHDGTAYTGAQPGETEVKYKDCYSKLTDDYQSLRCDDSGLPSNAFKYVCTKLDGKTSDTTGSNVVEVKRVQYRGCYPLLKTIKTGELTLTQLEENLKEWFKTIPGTDPPKYLSGNGYACDDKDNCNSAVAFKISSILCSFAVIFALLVNKL